MKLIIDIPEEKYKAITEMYETFPKDMKDWGLEAIKNGTTVEMAEDCVSREAIEEIKEPMTDICGNDIYVARMEDLRKLPSVRPQPKSEDMGEVSDGYHTFNQLYHQRAILFATIVNQNKERAWKSYKHEDGKYCFDKDGEWFIVGIDTPLGSYTYHYSKEYWDYFDCEELECGKPWDGHTEEDVTRLLSLLSVTSQPKRGKWIIDDKEYNRIWHCHCSNCKKDPQDYIGGTENWWLVRLPDYCPNCGADMKEEQDEK